MLLNVVFGSILFFSVLHSAVAAKSIAESDVAEPSWVQPWTALLHLYQGKPQIPDASFLLSLPNQTADYFDIELEQQATIEAFKRQPELICRFPARWLLLNQVFPNTLANIQPPSCSDYQTFLEQAPTDIVSVVFASENLTSPMSMLGHGMLSLEGVRVSGQKVQHSVSFFIEMNSTNPISMAKEAIIDGEMGVFQVAPLRSYYHYYRQTEQRNVWRYHLRLTNDAKRLVQAHIWELKHSKIPYYFHKHNCATLSLDILRVANPRLNRPSWVSPKDVIKAVAQQGMIAQTEVLPSTQWHYKALKDITPQPIRQAVEDWLDGGPALPSSQGKTGFLQRQYAHSIIEAQYDRGVISEKDYQSYLSNEPLKKDSETYQIDLLDYKSPLKTQQDAHWQLGAMQLLDKYWLTFNWLPIGHGLEDDNRHYFGETELKLSEFTLKYSPLNRELKLHQFQLYSAKAINPRDAVTEDVSGFLTLGAVPFYDRHHNEFLVVESAAGLGFSKAINQDIISYGLLGVGIFGHQDLGARLYLEPEVGVFINELWEMKTQVAMRRRFTTREEPYTQLSFKQSLYMKDRSLMLDLMHHEVGKGFWSGSFQWRFYY